MLLILLLFCYGLMNHATATAIDFHSSSERTKKTEPIMSLENKILEAKSLLISLGVSETNLCRYYDPRITISATHGQTDEDYQWLLPFCEDQLHQPIGGNRDDFFETFGGRRLVECEEQEISISEDPWHFMINALFAFCCVITAALAAGLTMGLLSIDPLMLLVKIRASHSEEEKAQAEAILPVVKQHHLLLVTLLLLNSLANEALPVFLEKLVSPIVSILLSVTFLLIFGEIIPSAVFTGPKKLQYAANMVPLVKTVMFFLYPIAYPISKVLDKYLHEDEDDGAFDRGEISALVRIQYEERIANKRERKMAKMRLANLDKSEKEHKFLHPKARHVDLENALKAVKSESVRMTARDSLSDVQSIHMDEVMMVEGALQMKTKTAMDVFTPLHRMFAVPENLILNEDSVVDIYSSGYSRIPVYEHNPLKPKSQTAIKGILITKHLIVVNMSEDRPLVTMPLLIPPCVSPKMNLVQLVNLFQTGRSGHFALVCARPTVANTCLRNGNAVPAEAGVMGIITLEDVLEELLQEEIYDENDQMEKEAEKIALWVAKKWKRKLERRTDGERISMSSIVIDAVAASTENEVDKKASNESTSLLESSHSREISKRDSGLLGSIFQSIGYKR